MIRDISQIKQPRERAPRTRFLKNLAHLSRTIMGFVFMISGFAKVIDPWGTSIKVDEYMMIYGIEELLPLSMGFSIWLCGAELLMGCMLMFKVRIRFVSIFALMSMSIFTVVTFLSATFLPVEDCGCFGEVIKLTPWQTFYKNLFLLPLSFIVWYRYRPDKILSFKRLELFLATCFFFISMGIGVYSYLHLPIIDYLPYKIGLDLPSAIQRGRETNTNNVETYLIYRNRVDGKLRKFTLKDSEWHDETKWEWVETETITSERNIRPLLSEFSLSDISGEDKTFELLERDGVLNILFVTTVNSLSDKCLEKMKELIKSGDKAGETTIYVTPEKLDPAVNFLGIEGYNIDPTTMKTVLRASSGLVRLRDGVIERKSTCRDI